MSLYIPPRYLLIDIDNCLVPYDRDHVRYITDVIVDTVLELDEKARCVFKGDRDLVARLADHYYTQYGQSILGFAQEHNIPASDISRTYHERLDPDKCVNPTAEDQKRLYEFKKWLMAAKRSGAVTDYVAFTQSTSVWAQKILFEKLDLHAVFNRQNIISADTYGHRFKHRDRRPYEVAMNRMGVNDPNECLVIDDSRGVLKHAFDRMCMKTCMVTHGVPVADGDRRYLYQAADNIGDIPRCFASLSR